MAEGDREGTPRAGGGEEEGEEADVSLLLLAVSSCVSPMFSALYRINPTSSANACERYTTR